MTVSATESASGNQVVIGISGRFDFTCHQAFLDAYKDYPRQQKQFVVDLSGVDYMDSSAMGMLLQLREHSDRSVDVALVNSNPDVKGILRIANFNKLFAIE